MAAQNRKKADFVLVFDDDSFAFTRQLARPHVTIFPLHTFEPNYFPVIISTRRENMGCDKLHFFPQYIFSTRNNSQFEAELQTWTNVFTEITAEKLLDREAYGFYGISWLSKRLGLSRKKLEQSCQRLFGVTPGYLMRICRIFLLATECKRREKAYRVQLGYDKSALIEMSADFGRSFKRVFGLTWAQLKERSKEAHWVWCLWGENKFGDNSE